MSTKTVIARMDEVLTSLEFHRKKATWTRTSGPFVDVIDIQVSKAGDSMTINAGVLDADVYETCWGARPPSVVEVPSCTVHARVGQLIDLKDLWWPLSGERTPESVVEKLRSHVLPFLEQMHSHAAMERFLTDAEVTKQKYPLPILHLAVLRYRRGDKIGACGVLAELRRGALGAWRNRAAEVEDRLGCETIG
jgi:hypothetical protein